jgi:hypothetical protein
MATFMGTPGRTCQTRGGTYTADVNGMLYGVPATGFDQGDLVDDGATPVITVPNANFRNLIDGGDFSVNPWQRNVPGLASSNAIATPITSTFTYFADRWGHSGGASSSITPSKQTNTTVPGFNNSLRVQRTAANADTTIISTAQVLETGDCYRLQGQTVTLSFWAASTANYSGGALTVKVVSGTGANQSAANAISGSWSGQANVINTTVTLTSTMQRFQASGAVPAASTQLAVIFQWTPAGTAGTTDAVDFMGIQLEIGSVAGPFEYRDIQVELEICQRYAWIIAEPAAAVVVGMGACNSTTAAIIYMATPVQMRAAPTVTVSAGTFHGAPAGVTASGTAAAGTTHTPNAITINLSSLTATTAGFGTPLVGGGGSGYIVASADF